MNSKSYTKPEPFRQDNLQHEPHCPVPRANARGEGAVCICLAKSIKFTDLEIGTYFAWKSDIYCKVSHGRAMCLDNDRILDFGLHNECEIVEKPKNRIDEVIGLLDRALIQAHIDSESHSTNPAKILYIKLDLERKIATTSVYPFEAS